MAKYCTNCGKELIKGAGFCQNCGIKVKIQPEPVIPQEPVQQQQEQAIIQPSIKTKPVKKSNKKLFGIIGIIIIIAVVVIASLFLFVLKGDDSTSENTAETDIIGAWRLSYNNQTPSYGPDDLDTNWIFNNNGTIVFQPHVDYGFEEYYISNDEICFTGYYYPDPRCYEFSISSSKNSLTLKNDVVTMTFIRIV